MKTVSIDRKNNSISFLRLIAALTVFAGHAATHLQLTLPKPILWFNGLFEGVPIFFLISGFLIWHSLSTNADLKNFAVKRLLRLYPELWCAVLFSTISLLILYTENIQVIPFAAWIVCQSTVLQFWTPDFLRQFGCGVPNGSLWTVGVTVQSYAVIWLMHRFLHNKSKVRWLWAPALAVVFTAIIPLTEQLLPELAAKLYMQTFLPYFWIFLLGAFLSEHFDTLIVYCKKYWFVFLAIAAVFEFTNFDFGGYGVLKTLFISPALFGFAYRFPRLNIPHDITYGLYLFHMVVINVLIQLGYTGSYAYFFLALAFTAVLAGISYVCIGRFYRRKKKKESLNAH